MILGDCSPPEAKLLKCLLGDIECPGEFLEDLDIKKTCTTSGPLTRMGVCLQLNFPSVPRSPPWSPLCCGSGLSQGTTSPAAGSPHCRLCCCRSHYHHGIICKLGNAVAISIFSKLLKQIAHLNKKHFQFLSLVVEQNNSSWFIICTNKDSLSKSAPLVS